MAADEGALPLLPLGARVKLVGLSARADLNGKEGTVTGPALKAGGLALSSNGRFPVVLDGQSSGLSLKADNLELVGKQTAPALCGKGFLIQEEGRVFSLVLDMLVVGASSIAQSPELHAIGDVNVLRNSGPEGLQVVLSYQAQGYSYFYKAPKGPSVLQLMREYASRLPTNFLSAPPTPGSRAGGLRPVPRGVFEAREHVADGGDAARWGSSHGRLSGAFWVVRERADGAGTDLVSEDENGPCAVGVGMSSSLAELARRTGRSLPLLMVLTLLPFKGRLVSDGIIRSKDGARGPAPPASATPEEARRILQRLAKAEAEGTLLFALPHGPEGSVPAVPQAGASSSRRSESSGGGGPESAPKGKGKKQAPLEPWEEEIARSIAAAEQSEDFWVMRRFGYTEQDNPEHACVIMSGKTGAPIGDPKCFRALEPPSEELLRWLAEAVRSGRRRPQGLGVDSKRAADRMERVLEGVIMVGYYPPPSAEETAVINGAGPSRLAADQRAAARQMAEHEAAREAAGVQLVDGKKGCWHCGKLPAQAADGEGALRKCSGCRVVRSAVEGAACPHCFSRAKYCGEGCLREAWGAGHKAECKKLQAKAAAAGAAGGGGGGGKK